MNVSELLAEAGMFMLVGMLVVFIFLSVLILAIKILAKFAEAYPDPVTTTRNQIKPTTDASKNSPQVIAAITAAVKQYKARNK